MLRYLRDPANAITAGGLLCSALALYLALAGHLDLAVSVALWAVLADHLDGIVAGKTPNRAPEMAKMGKSLDGFADMVYGSILPTVIIIELGHTSALSLITGIALLLAGAIRLSYFANFGLSSDGRFMGVPLSYDIPLLALFFLLRPMFAADIFILAVTVSFLILAVLHVASIRVRAPNGAMYAAIVLFAVVASGGLLMRSIG
jgi:CDP-diacylglycerol---serine O-phosphatidyltransferase